MVVTSISIRKRLTQMIIWILLWSFVCTVPTWFVLFKIGQERMNAANHYEKMIPDLEEQMKQEHLTKTSLQEKLNEIIPRDGFTYKVVDENGQFQYGTTKNQSNISSKKIIESLNLVKSGQDKSFVKYIPLMDRNNQLQGVLLLEYDLKVTPIHASDNTLLRSFSSLVLITPFLYIILFTVLFVRRLSKEIDGPIQQLMNATSFIRNRDLKFSIQPYGKITEIQDLTEAFEKMRSELEQSLQREWSLQQERKDMIAALAHDIRTPLTIIQGHIEGLEESRKKGIDRFDRYVAVIKTNIQRAVKLVKDLNQTATLDHEHFHLHKVPFDATEFLKEKKMEYELLCKEKGIQFIYDIKDDRIQNTPIEADPDRLSQVLDNVLSNSIRFVEQGEIHLNVRITDKALYMQVIDTGPGFEKGKEADVFKPFYQGKSINRQGHSGLGLYITKTIIEKHGGQIQASNAKQGGAIILMRIPLS
ncbi:ATP-binding protein [Microbacteriaceae bacterium 4G12]